MIMIKLFEDFEYQESSLKLLQKCKDFIDSVITDRNSSIHNNDKQSVFWLMYYFDEKIPSHSMRDVKLDFEVTVTVNYESYDNKIFIDNVDDKYLTLERYMSKILNTFFKKVDFYFKLGDDLTEIVDNINFDIEDYKIFGDTERFGL